LAGFAGPGGHLVTICIVDTSVFCNVLDIPHKNQHRATATATLRRYIGEDFALLLPLAAIFETGKHISHLPDGRLRRDTAKRFVKQVRGAVDGRAPWRTTPIPRPEDLAIWLDEFPERAMCGLSLADLSMIKLFEQQCALNPARRVFIWSYDEDDLSAYDRTI
jgi:hypothetical protein